MAGLEKTASASMPVWLQRTEPDPDSGVPAVPREGERRPAAACAAPFVETLVPGTTVGRYIVERQLGEGGMGVVYLARDPELGRHVALKRLHRDLAGQDAAHERVLREARAMARLAHPNIVAVYDIVSHEGHVVIAMELVSGETLREWLTREKHDDPQAWRRIIPLFVQAGRGLEAAHAVGLVHRDFKPDNVLLGSDGRARVTDFGLAREMSEEAPGLVAGESGDRRRADLVGRSLTRSSRVLGTAPYMSPEQHRGNVDARSDQFAFCAALYEALAGNLPFEGDSWEELRTAVFRGAPKPLGARAAPTWIQRVVRRGLETDPERRFPSMTALLAALERDPAVRRRRWAVGAVALAATITAFPFAYRETRLRHARMCSADAELAGVWDGARRDAARSAFASSTKPYARDLWSNTERTLDRYAAAWTRTRIEACEATEVRREQSSKLMDLRMACLAERREELRGLTELLSHADDALVTRAVTAASSLTDLDECSDASVLHAKAEGPEIGRERVAPLRNRLARIKAQEYAGRFKEALAEAQPLLEEVRALSFPALEADVLSELGDLQGRNGDLEASEKTLYQAAWTADAAANDRARAWAWTTQLYYLGYVKKKKEAIPLVREQAMASAKRVPGDVDLQGSLDSALGSILLDDAKPAEARQVFEHQLALHERAHGRDCSHAYLALANIGLSYAHQHDIEHAVDAYTRALASMEKSVGPAHPDLASVLTHIGSVRDEVGDFRGAEDHYRRAVSIAEGALGPEHLGLSMHLGNLARALENQGRFAEALPLAERALALREKGLGPNAGKLVYPLFALGEAYEGLGEHEKAIAQLERALALPSAGFVGTVRAEVKFTLARALRAANASGKRDRRGDRARALALAREAKDELLAGPGAEAGHDARTIAAIDAWMATKPRRARR